MSDNADNKWGLPILTTIEKTLSSGCIIRKVRYGVLRRAEGGPTIPKFKKGHSVRLREVAHVAVQPGVGPGAKGEVVAIDGHGKRTPGAGVGEQLYEVVFEGFERADLVKESALEAL